MNVYDIMDKYAEAIRADAGVLAYCTTNYSQGLLIRIDDDSEKMLGSADAPYCLLMSVPGGDDSGIAESAQASIRVEVGTKSNDEDPTISTARTASANGVEKLGNGEQALDLFSLILSVIKGTTIDNCTLTGGSTVDANGSLYYPLALVVSTLTVNENKDLSTWN